MLVRVPFAIVLILESLIHSPNISEKRQYLEVLCNSLIHVASGIYFPLNLKMNGKTKTNCGSLPDRSWLLWLFSHILYMFIRSNLRA